MSTTFSEAESAGVTRRQGGVPHQRRRAIASGPRPSGQLLLVGEPPPGSPARPVRLTRRGRLVLLILVIAVAFTAFTLLGSPAASTSAVHHAPARTVVVEPGETLWDIASTLEPGQDPRELIAEIVELNSLSDAGSIRVGQPLYVPAP
jgi:hypothetical protein